MVLSRSDRLAGALLGCAVGDALGLPREGLSPRRAERRFGGAPLSHRLIFGRGMISDDTDHACMALQSLLAAPSSPERFAASLAWRLRGWLLTFPAGIGSATLRSIVKLWLGFPPSRSGVNSAGNGPAMRAPIIGVWFDADPAAREAFTLASTHLTHRHPLADDGALLIAHAAAGTPTLAALIATARTPELKGALERLAAPLARGDSVAQAAAVLGLENGVTGFILHTVPIALYAVLRHPTNFRAAVEETIVAGGDADTTGAIVGGILGGRLGAAAIPNDWLDGIAEWPRSVRWLRRLAASEKPLGLFVPGLFLRSFAQLVVVLAHGFRRLLP